MEKWKNVVGYEGFYQVSNIGRIRSLDRVVWHSRNKLRKLKSQILRPVLNNNYLKVTLCKNGCIKTTSIHRLVARAWIGPCPPNQQVRHGSKGRLNNSSFNLSYGTASDDCFDKRRDGTHGGRSVRRSDGKEYINMSVAAEDIGCHAGNICHTCHGRQKTACGWGFEFIDTKKKLPRPICRSDGVVFISVSDAARIMNCDASTISKVCNGQRKTTKGYGWEYI